MLVCGMRNGKTVLITGELLGKCYASVAIGRGGGGGLNCNRLQSRTKVVKTNAHKCLDLQAGKKYFIPLTPYLVLFHEACSLPGFVFTT